MGLCDEVVQKRRFACVAKVGIPDTAGDNALPDAAGRLADDLADTALVVCYPHSPDQSSQLTAMAAAAGMPLPAHPDPKQNRTSSRLVV